MAKVCHPLLSGLAPADPILRTCRHFQVSTRNDWGNQPTLSQNPQPQLPRDHTIKPRFHVTLVAPTSCPTGPLSVSLASLKLADIMKSLHNMHAGPRLTLNHNAKSKLYHTIVHRIAWIGLNRPYSRPPPCQKSLP